jgi:hypothetical protein
MQLLRKIEEHQNEMAAFNGRSHGERDKNDDDDNNNNIFQRLDHEGNLDPTRSQLNQSRLQAETHRKHRLKQMQKELERIDTKLATYVDIPLALVQPSIGFHTIASSPTSGIHLMVTQEMMHFIHVYVSISIGCISRR